MNIETRKYKLTLLTEQLGTVPYNQEVYAKYIQEKGLKLCLNGSVEEEAQTVQELEEKGWTGFHKDENGLFIYNYMIKGFFKSAIQTLMENKAIKKITAYKTWIDKAVFVEPRVLYFGVKEPDGVLERPLRVMTAQGPRVSVARSDYVNAGRSLEFEIKLFKNDKGLTFEVLEAAMEYGRFIGLGQWRSADYGRFEVECR